MEEYIYNVVIRNTGQVTKKKLEITKAIKVEDGFTYLYNAGAAILPVTIRSGKNHEEIEYTDPKSGEWLRSVAYFLNENQFEDYCESKLEKLYEENKIKYYTYKEKKLFIDELQDQLKKDYKFKDLEILNVKGDIVECKIGINIKEKS
jgi:hypothetical protein